MSARSVSRARLPRQSRRSNLDLDVTSGSFAPGELVRVSDPTGDFFAVADRAVVHPATSEMVRLREIALARGVEIVSARRVQHLSGDDLVTAVLAYLDAPEALRPGLTRAIDAHGGLVRAGWLHGWLTIGQQDTRYSIEMWNDGTLIHAAERYTFRERTWAVAS